MSSADCQYTFRSELIVKNESEQVVSRRVLLSQNIKVYDIFVKNGVGDYLNGKNFTKSGIANYETSEYALTAYTCGYGAHTTLKPENVVGFTLTNSQIKDSITGWEFVQDTHTLEFMFDSENNAIRIIDTVYTFYAN